MDCMTADVKQTVAGDAGWDPCPTGELRRLSKRLDRRDNLTRIPALALVSAVVPVLLALPFLSVAFTPAYPQLPMVCAEVHSLADKYVRHQIDDDVRARIDDHLRWCDRCNREMAELQQELPKNRAGVEGQVPVASRVMGASFAMSFVDGLLHQHDHAHGDCPHCNHAAHQ